MVEGTLEFLQATLNSLSSRLAIINAEGKIIAVNEAWNRFAQENDGDPQACGVGVNYLKVCDSAIGSDSEQAKSMANGIRAVLRGELHQFELEYPCHSRTAERWFVARVTRHAAKTPPRAVIAHEDVTSRRKAENALRQSEERYELAVLGSGAGLWDFDLTTNRCYFSPRCRELLGYPVEARQSAEDTPEFFYALLHPDDLPRVQSAIERHLVAREPYQIAYRLRTFTGDYRWYQAQGQALWDEAGKPHRMAGSIIDVTEQVRVETEKSRLEQQLRQAQKMEAIGTLAGGIAHDFNNILGAIVGYAELAHSSATTAVGRDDLQQILESCRRGRDIVRQILAFSRQEQPTKTRFSLQDVVGESLQILRATLPSSIDLHIARPSTPIEILGNRVQLGQVILNLGANAAQAIRGAPGRIELKLDVVQPGSPELAGWTPELPVRPYARLIVSDTGPGIPPEIQDRIFDPFFTTKAPGEGTGLGLSVVHGIVKSHDGAVRVQSKLGQGAAFTILLPLENHSGSANTSESLAAVQGDGETILLASADESWAQRLTREFENVGYRIAWATNGPAAVRRFAESPGLFSGVVADESLPGMPVARLVSAVAAGRPNLPFIVVAENVNSDAVANLRADGISAVENKAVSVARLTRLLHSSSR